MIFWMNIMYCEVSYLYIGLLIQLSYSYVGFLNIPPQTQYVILMKPLSLVNNSSKMWLNSAWLISRLDGLDLNLAWSDHDSMAQRLGSWNGLSSGSQLSGSMSWLDLSSSKYISHKWFSFFFFLNIVNKIKIK